MTVTHSVHQEVSDLSGGLFEVMDYVVGWASPHQKL